MYGNTQSPHSSGCKLEQNGDRSLIMGIMLYLYTHSHIHSAGRRGMLNDAQTKLAA